ncbi:MAG: sigma 54-interacting transcriptional regulator [Proteobacteria bacterium]|nr:sigma 54-interacting transcriptional regulator [Pseudomonadota bacterium]
MNIPPFVQTWSNNKRKRFYIFNEERIYFNENGFYTLEVGEHRPHVLSFKPCGTKILIRPENDNDFIFIAGAKRKSINTECPMFFTFRNQEFFIDGFTGYDSSFHMTGVDIDSSFSDGLAYARNDNIVFIIGNTGTGKEILAKNIHYNSARRHEPFLTFNCASFDAGIAEMELFGNIKGAFTNAMQVSKGIFMNAGKGTIMLDEIGSLPMSVQPMLLRAIELGEVKAVGSDIVKQHKARFIFTSNISPMELLRSGKIREDLFYRIESCVVYLPELKNKKNYIIELAEFFTGDEYKISDDVKKMFIEYEWPGNIRELKNVMERAKTLVNLTDVECSRIIKPEHISLKNSSDRNFSDIHNPTEILDIRDSEKENISKILQKNLWDIGSTSRELNICRSTLLSKIKEYNLVKF